MIQEAHELVSRELRKTPCDFCPELSARYGVPIYIKLEFLQVTGSFKPRGALFRMAQLTSVEKQKGIVTCSAGNHGKACAFVAHKMGIPCRVFVPKNVDEAKLKGIKSYGAEVVHSPYIGYDDTEALAQDEAKREMRPFISPFDDDYIMAGNGGTISMEIHRDIPEVQNILFPVGGGGLGAGLSFYIKEKRPKLRLIGCQHKDSPALKLSLDIGKTVTRLPAIETLAGGIEGGLGANCFYYLKERIDDVALLSEQDLYRGVLWMLEQHQFLIEPSASPPLAALLTGKIEKLVGPTVLVLTGRNVSLSNLGAMNLH